MHYYAEKLNEIGFEHLGEPVTVAEIEEFTKEREKTQLNRTGKIATPRTRKTRMGRIILESGEELEMEMDTIRAMVNRAERYQYE
jgi:hypothetical protein